MKALFRHLTGAAVAETIDHEPNHDSGPEGPHQGAQPMPTIPARDKQQRYTFASGERPLEGFTIKRAIGRGGFGEVYYATSDAGKEVALKLITRNLEIERRGVVQCMNLKSSHLIAIHDLKSNEEGDSFVVMEYVNGPSLASILAQHPSGLPADQVRLWLKGLVEGVSYLHDHGIVHRDLKPANLFLEDGVVKIGDYGLSKAISQSKGETGHSECVGTCYYMAPEMSTGKYQKPIDVYAIGVILYEMVTGRVPFDGETVGEVLMKHLTSRPDLSPLQQPYKSIVERALAKDPNHRPERVQELLLPGDARREPEVRFIGDPNPPAASPRPEPKDDVLRIGMDEPVMYIGPETRPPQPRQPKAFHAWLWGTPVKRTAYTRPPRPARPARRRAPPRPTPVYVAPPVAPAPPPPEPVPLPSPRVRVAELATSMLLAAPVSAVASTLSFPILSFMGMEQPRDPMQLVILFLFTLLGSWAALVPAKLWEGRNVPAPTRRFVMSVLGLILGIGGIGLAIWTELPPVSSYWSHVAQETANTWRHQGLDPALIAPVGTAAFFGLAFFAGAWQNLTARDRKSRFRFWPVIWSGLIGAALAQFLPSPQPWAGLVFASIALVAQVVSPWNKQAAIYARYARYAPRRVA